MINLFREITCLFGRHRFGAATWHWIIPAESYEWWRVCETCGQIKRIADQGPPPVYWTRNKYGVLQEHLEKKPTLHSEGSFGERSANPPSGSGSLGGSQKGDLRAPLAGARSRWWSAPWNMIAQGRQLPHITRKRRAT